MADLSEFVLTARGHLSPILSRSGNILYSSAATLRPGTLYLLGLNPGGDPNDARHREQTIGSVLDALPAKRDNEYLDVSWRERGDRKPPGQSKLQRRVQWLSEMLGVDLRDVCAANLIFARSTGAESSDYARLAPVCWPVHELILDIVRPKLVVAYGNSAVSPYAYLLQRFGASREVEFPSGHVTWTCRAFGVGGMRVAGLPHLSRYAIDHHPDVGRWLTSMLEA